MALVAEVLLNLMPFPSFLQGFLTVLIIFGAYYKASSNFNRSRNYKSAKVKARSKIHSFIPIYLGGH